MKNVSANIDNKISRCNAFQKPAEKHAEPSFGHFYGLKGTPSELEQMTNLFKKKKMDFNIVEILTNGSKKIIGILTGGEKSSKDANKLLQNRPSRIIDVEKFLNPENLIYINPDTGQKNEIKKFQKDGLEFYGNVATDKNGNWLKYSSSIAMINFPKPLSLKESIQKLSSLEFKIENKEDNFCFPHSRFLETFSCNEVIKNCEDFIGGKIQGLKGYGCHSIAFATDLDKVFKVSFSPNTPIVPRIYDIQVFDKIKIPNPSNAKNKNLFSVLEKNGKSWVETKITPEDENSLLATIKSCGDMPNEYGLWDFGVEQIAKIGNQPYLVDAPTSEARKLWKG